MKTYFEHKDLNPDQLEQVRICYATFCPDGWKGDDIRELIYFLEFEHNIQLKNPELYLIVQP